MSPQIIRAQDLVEAQLYESKEQVAEEALRHFLMDRPELRIQVAIHRYRTDESLSLAQAAAIAGTSLERMKEILDRHGVSLRLGSASVQEARAEGDTIEEWLDAYPG
jgi:predicted HTH domain antitoxin